MLVVRVVAAVSGGIVAVRESSEWTLANVDCVGRGRRGHGLRVAIGSETERRQWTILFVFSARRMLEICGKLIVR